MHLEPIYIGGETKEQEQYLPCKFHDVPGLDEAETMTEDKIMKIINAKTDEVNTFFHSFKLLLILINKFLKLLGPILLLLKYQIIFLTNH